MRYRVELARDFGAADSKRLIQWFKSLQDRLGRWHDRTELSRFIARTLANPGLLLQEPRASIELLKEVEKDISISSREVDALFRLATESEGRDQFDEWVKLYCGNIEHVSAEEPISVIERDRSAQGQTEPVAQAQAEPAAIFAEPVAETTESVQAQEPPPGRKRPNIT